MVLKLFSGAPIGIVKQRAKRGVRLWDEYSDQECLTVYTAATSGA